MEKVKFKYLYSFKYNNKSYLFLSSYEYPFYFLEYNQKTGTMDFPDVKTYLELYDKFQSNYMFTLKDKFKTIKEGLNKEHLFVKPLVKVGATLVSLTMILSLCGCTQTKDIPKSDPPIAYEETIKDEVESYLNSYGIKVDIKDYNSDRYYFVKECITSEGKKIVTLNTVEELKQLKGITKDITYDDVINAFKSNSNITDEEKELILTSLGKMMSSSDLKGLDLTTLYINASRMKVEKDPYDTLIEITGRDKIYAYFDPSTGIIHIPSDIPFEKFEFIHEVLGHGSLVYKEEIDGISYNYDGFNQIMLPTEDRYTGYKIGTMFSEGAANSIARICFPEDDTKTFYELFEEELRLIASICNCNLGTLLNYKGESFYDLLYANNVNYPVKYIIESDAIFNGIIYTEFDTLLESLMLDSIYEDYINSDDLGKEEIIKTTIDTMKNSYFKEGLEFNYPGGTISYDPEKSSENVETKIRGVN